MQKWMARAVAAAWVPAWLLGSVACTDPVDKAAKARIFSPEDPPQVVASATEALPPDQAAQDARVERRILSMGAAEATERLGSFRYHAALRFDWDGPTALSLSEDRTLEAGPGGVAGDYHARVENTRDQGLEVVRSSGRVFARGRYGSIRERTRDRGMSERAREEVYGALSDVTSLFEGRIQLEPRTTVSLQGRSAWRFTVSLGPADPSKAAPPSDLPAVVVPKGANDESTERRRTFFASKEPKSLIGDLWVDAETSVVLKAKLEGALRIPAGGASPRAATVKVTLDTLISDVGKVGSQTPPKDALKDADKPSGIAEALERFGIVTRDAGTAPEPAAETDDESPQG